MAIEKKLERVHEVTVGRADALLGSASNLLKRVVPARQGNAANVSGLSKPADKVPLPVAVQEHLPSPLSLAQRFLSSVATPVETAAIVVVIAIFILLQREDLRDRLIRLF